jgi:hypothetical protein
MPKFKVSLIRYNADEHAVVEVEAKNAEAAAQAAYKKADDLEWDGGGKGGLEVDEVEEVEQ